MSVTLYVVRHGHAVMHADTDAERPLSDIGQKEAVLAAQHLKSVLPDVFLASPYLRAQQTAHIIHESAGITTPITTESGITPDDHPTAVAEILAAQGDNKTILMVSHNPLVSALVSWLLDGHFQGPYVMGTASVACLEAELIGAGTATLKWLKHVN
ncbi:MAG: phosphohistidine phosphatase SixA [Pseudomonadales bacterium]|nr:phosphohistidine phosphatase SixA [Pseudomonadales bacterium]